MKCIDTNGYRLQILVLLARLRDDVSRMAAVGAATRSIAPNHEVTSMSIPMADIAGDSFDREWAFSLMENKEEIVQQLEDALDRIELGTYGGCEECGGRISKARLAAVPYATRCIKCASQLEQG
jgi:DnaK suppressor protein